MADESAWAYETDPHLMTVISKKFEMATRDMSQTLLKSARSGVINSARDFSSAITLFNGDQFMIDEGLPIHLGNIHLTPKETIDLFDDISPGDCFLTNSPYSGNTHHGDYTLHVPVFYENEPLFWSINRAHQADVGAPSPTTYSGEAENIYQEGPHFPAVRIQENYEDKEDIVRLCKLNIRASDLQWHGDYLAQVSAVRTGEEKIKEICEEYGMEQIKQFASDWISYGQEMMKSEISKLPNKEVKSTSYHDPIPDVTNEKIPVNVKINIDSNNGKIEVDIRDNIENIPCGFNLSEATTVAAIYGGIFNNLSSDLPHNHGSISLIDIKMDEGKIVGKPEYPVGTATATTNIAGVLFNTVQSAFAQFGTPYGIAEGNAGIEATRPVISGEDYRRDESFINQLIFGAGGGPASHGNDGWITYSIAPSGGVTRRDSVEIVEQNYPIQIDHHKLKMDTAGPGKWRGSPGSTTGFTPRGNSMTFAFYGEGHECPPKGVLGGGSSTTLETYKITPDSEREDLPTITMDPIRITPDETIVCENCGGGGYGNPMERDPMKVLHDVREELVSIESAESVYGVVIEERDGEIFIDEVATEKIRENRGTSNSDDRSEVVQ